MVARQQRSLIISGAASYRHYERLFRVHADGSGVPEPLPLPTGFQGSFSPDGQSLAYQPITQWEEAWKRYVGGQTTPIWIVNLRTLDRGQVPRDNSNDSDPVWAGSSVDFLSDRNGPVSLFRYDTGSKQVSPVVPNSGYDLKSLQAGPGGLVYKSVPFILSTPRATATKPSPSRSKATCPIWRLTAPFSPRTRFATPHFRPAARAPSLRPTAKSSRFLPKKETPVI